MTLYMVRAACLMVIAVHENGIPKDSGCDPNITVFIQLPLHNQWCQWKAAFY